MSWGGRSTIPSSPDFLASRTALVLSWRLMRDLLGERVSLLLPLRPRWFYDDLFVLDNGVVWVECVSTVEPARALWRSLWR